MSKAEWTEVRDLENFEKDNLAHFAAEPENTGTKSNRFRCDFCPNTKEYRYDKMICSKVWERDPEWDGEHDQPSEFHWVRKCVECVMREEGVDFGKAMDHIYRNNGTLQRRVQKTSKLQQALLAMKSHFESLGVTKTKSQLIRLSREKVETILEGILPFVAMKRDILVKMSHDLKRQEELRAELRNCTDPVRIAAIMKEVDEYNADTDREYIAFKDPVTKEVDWLKWTAATYHDELSSHHSGAFRYWFICLCNHSGWICGSMLLSKMWKRKYEIGTARSKKNSWKCTVCDGNYSTWWGVVVEVSEQTAEGVVLHYMRADPPPDTVLDIKAREIQETVAKRARTAQEVYDCIPSFAPHISSLVTVVNEQLGQYKFIDIREHAKLPKWEWMDILTLGLSMAEGQSMAESMAKLQNVRLGYEEC